MSDLAGSAWLGRINLGGEGRYRRTQVPCWTIPVLVVLLHMTPGRNELSAGVDRSGGLAKEMELYEQGLVRHLGWGLEFSSVNNFLTQQAQS